MVIPSNRQDQLFLKDDYVRDVEGIIYLVILNAHPPESVLSIPKYVPEQGGRWRGSYSRLFRNYTSHEFHKAASLANFRIYEFYSNVFDKKLLAIPHNYIAEHFVPENKLKELMLSSHTNISSQERNTVDLARIFSEFGIKQYQMGITGSLLYDLHMPFSNLSIILYGLKPMEIYLNNIDEIVAEYRNISFKSQFLKLDTKKIELGARIRTFLWMNEISTAIHVNEYPNFQFVYGSEKVHNLGKCEIVAAVTNVKEGFVRKYYSLRSVEIITWPQTEVSLPEILKLKIFSGRSEDIVFREGELVRTSGMLQRIDPVEERQEGPFYQLSVGLEEFPGYVCPLALLNRDS